MLARLAISETSVLRASGGAVPDPALNEMELHSPLHRTGIACYSAFTTTYIDFGGPSTLASPPLVGKAESSIKNKECYETNWVIASPGFKKSQVLLFSGYGTTNGGHRPYAFISNNMKRKTPASVSLPPKRSWPG
ncbi:uncharacterized protein TrAtP1_006498 [Trichoderma atroviride]|uniref:uncharacterized protein n=1 Tax=Hypocrea atroviridis TaxID=63577 RepID=UPI0033267FA2|nr:hypothetical protein TrAtP1_006498 [Trichoderma atroviride]